MADERLRGDDQRLLDRVEQLETALKGLLDIKDIGITAREGGQGLVGWTEWECVCGGLTRIGWRTPMRHTPDCPVESARRLLQEGTSDAQP